jgi:hypothetical protein
MNGIDDETGELSTEIREYLELKNSRAREVIDLLLECEPEEEDALLEELAAIEKEISNTLRYGAVLS